MADLMESAVREATSGALGRVLYFALDDAHRATCGAVKYDGYALKHTVYDTTGVARAIARVASAAIKGAFNEAINSRYGTFSGTAGLADLSAIFDPPPRASSRS